MQARLTASAILVALASTGCGSILGEGDQHLVEIRLAQPVPTALAGDVQLSESARYGSVAPGDVASLVATVTSIQFLPASEGDAESAWQTLTLDAPVDIDFGSLPTSDESPLVIAAGMLAAGDYRKVRLFVSGATIVFANQISLGNAQSFDPDTPYPVDIPSASNTGIKTDLTFSVTDDGMGGTNAVDLFFDPGATYQNVTVTGSGVVKMAPVVKSKL